MEAKRILNTQSNRTFHDLGIAPGLIASLEKLHFSTPTPIQEQAIPPAIQGKDLVGIAQTGTGKTFAFGLPMMQRLWEMRQGINLPNESAARPNPTADGLGPAGIGLIVLPTRELALQVDESLQKVGRYAGLRTAVLIGGAPMGGQVRSLKNNPHIIIATPGRLLDHMAKPTQGVGRPTAWFRDKPFGPPDASRPRAFGRTPGLAREAYREQKILTLNAVRIVVFDEADRMLDMGFMPQIQKILHALPKERQTMLFSATMPDQIMQIAVKHMQFPIRIEIAPTGTTAANVSQELFVAHKDQKVALLAALLEKYQGPTLVFTRTKYGAKKVMYKVRDMGVRAAELHSNKSLSQRKEALEGFKRGKYRVLVATDIASRGIDVAGIELVINFDLPSTPDDYVHRIGRTARAGASGHAITFAMPDERREVAAIERLIRKDLPVSQLPALPQIRQILPADASATRGRFERFEHSKRFSYPRSFERTASPFSSRSPRGGAGTGRPGRFPRREGLGRPVGSVARQDFHRKSGIGHRSFGSSPRLPAGRQGLRRNSSGQKHYSVGRGGY